MNHERKSLSPYSSRGGNDFPSPGEKLEPSARFEFPKMLYKMLEDCTFDENYCKIISWQPHGFAFKVHNRDELEHILSQWFREKYESFRCLLEQWGFLRLSRGKDRGCWYHNKFFHRSNAARAIKYYGSIGKYEFIEGMPEYISPRDEPDLEHMSTADSRISPKKRKVELNLLLEKESKIRKVGISNKKGFESNRDKTKVHRYAMATLKECRYCHELFAPQGFLRHEESCRIARMKQGWKNMNESGSNSENESDDDSDSDSEDDDLNRNTLSDSDDDEEEIDTSSTNRVPCRFCGAFFTKVGVQLHERACKAAGNRNNDHLMGSNNRKVSNPRRSVLSDDSSMYSEDSAESVDSIESGCRICGFDDDHANLLLCEGCDKEFHTYCLNPPLQSVPADDWFCDTCRLRMGKAEVELCELLKEVPPEIVDRFGEICFAKSAKTAHWWPALIFDPRSFLHNREVVDLARRNLGKRFLVFFFENQDAFAAIPKKWIMTWEDGLKKQFDKGRSVRHASQSRRQQFEKAMDLAGEAFEDISCSDDESRTTGYDSQSDSDSSRRGIPRVIGGKSTIFDYNPRFDWKALRAEVVKEVNATNPSVYKTIELVDKNISVRASGKSQAQLTVAGRLLYIGLFEERPKAAYAIQLFKKRLDAAKNEFEKKEKRSSDDLAGSQLPIVGVDASDGNESQSKQENKFGTFTDKKPIRLMVRSSTKANQKSGTNAKVDLSVQVEPPQKESEEKSDSEPETSEESDSEEPDLQEEIEPILPPLSNRERDELLMNTPFCHYYLLPLSEL